MNAKRVRIQSLGLRGGVGLLALLLAGCLMGCQALAAPWILTGEEPTKRIKAEFPHLKNKKIAILVWADSDARFEYPFVRLEMAEHIKSELEARIDGVKFSSNRQIIEMQDRDPDWDRKPPAKIGQRLDAERVISIEVSQYSMREPESRHLLRGRIAAQVSIYDTSRPDSGHLYRTEVAIMHPEKSEGRWGNDEAAIRREAMEAFATALVKRFYDHDEKVD
ncbi:MAG: hypothetical protein JNG88_12470 [Phycisphaerales bacterium]|nr:hypothetical protein [Phycisphaerales bacterium]